MTSGNLAAFQWIEAVSKDDTELIDAIRTLRRHPIGLRAVNTSWDSGLLIPSDEERRQGWTIEHGRAVNPAISRANSRSPIVLTWSGKRRESARIALDPLAARARVADGEALER